jgi:hypothetical protein
MQLVITWPLFGKAGITGADAACLLEGSRQVVT